MKKNNFTLLKLNKKSISILESYLKKGGRWTNNSICRCETEVGCDSNGSCYHQEC